MAIELAELIAQLRAELSQALAQGEGSALSFELGPIDLELSVAVEKSAGAGAKVRFWVVEADADGRASSTGTQTLKLRLEPRWREGLGSRRVAISGAAEDRER